MKNKFQVYKDTECCRVIGLGFEFLHFADDYLVAHYVADCNTLSGCRLEKALELYKDCENAFISLSNHIKSLELEKIENLLFSLESEGVE